jgi:3-hydroxyacyl-CoA dehydrogenase
MKAGFGWENGPFEIWDATGVEKIEIMKAEGLAPAAWVNDMLASEIQVLFSKRRSNVFYNIQVKLQTKFRSRRLYYPK